MITPDELQLRLTRILRSRLTGRHGVKPRWTVSCTHTGYKNDILVTFSIANCDVFTRIYGSTHPVSGIVGNLLSWYESQVDQIVMYRISRALWEITDRELVHAYSLEYANMDVPWWDIVATTIVCDPRHNADREEWVAECVSRAEERGYANMPSILWNAYRAHWEDR